MKFAKSFDYCFGIGILLVNVIHASNITALLASLEQLLVDAEVSSVSDMSFNQETIELKASIISCIDILSIQKQFKILMNETGFLLENNVPTLINLWSEERKKPKIESSTEIAILQLERPKINALITFLLENLVDIYTWIFFFGDQLKFSPETKIDIERLIKLTKRLKNNDSKNKSHENLFVEEVDDENALFLSFVELMKNIIESLKSYSNDSLKFENDLLVYMAFEKLFWRMKKKDQNDFCALTAFFILWDLFGCNSSKHYLNKKLKFLTFLHTKIVSISIQSYIQAIKKS